MANGQFVAYYRVSTQRQGASGLGLDAQKAAVENYLNGGRWELLASFTEVETGKGANALAKRPQLRLALEACKKRGAVLLIAKLDRLQGDLMFRTIAIALSVFAAACGAVCAQGRHRECRARLAF